LEVKVRQMVVAVEIAALPFGVQVTRRGTGGPTTDRKRLSTPIARE
jgi:hypothetical protein